MKKNLIIAGIAGIVVLGGAFGASAFSSPNQNDNITKEEAREITIKENENIDPNKASNGVVRVTKLNDNTSKNGNNQTSINMDEAVNIAKDHTTGKVVEKEFEAVDQEYELEVKNKQEEVELTIDARNGTVAKMETETKDHKVKNQSKQKAIISMDEAVAIAQKHASGKVVEKEYDADDREYEVEIKNDSEKVEITIDARSGKVTEYEKETIAKKTKKQSTSKGKNKEKISMDEAIAIATKEFPGKVVEAEYDRDDAEYEIEIKTKNMEAEMTIDAYTGKIKEKEIEREDD